MEFKTYQEIVDHFRSSFEDDDLQFFSPEARKSFDDALLYAGLVHNTEGRRLAHMNRIRYDSIARGLTVLNRHKERLLQQPDFHSLLQTIYDLLNEPPRVNGLNEVYYYDTAFRLGCYLGLMPKHIYLHAGTREGAIAAGVPIGNSVFIDIENLPKGLRAAGYDLEPYEWESLLCIYKQELADIPK